MVEKELSEVEHFIQELEQQKRILQERINGAQKAIPRCRTCGHAWSEHESPIDGLLEWDSEKQEHTGNKLPTQYECVVATRGDWCGCKRKKPVEWQFQTGVLGHG